MTGKELILYILNNNLEDSEVFQNGRLLGFHSLAEYAELKNVGTETVRLWVNFGYLKAVIIYDEIYIPYNAEVKNPKQEA